MELVPRSGQELYEMTCLVGELLPPLPGDGVFAVDGLLAAPGTMVRDPMVWQWQDDRGAWHTYTYQECRGIEAAYLAGEAEVMLNTSTATFSLNLLSRHEIREDTGTARSATVRVADPVHFRPDPDPANQNFKSGSGSRIRILLFYKKNTFFLSRIFFAWFMTIFFFLMSLEVSTLRNFCYFT